LRKIVPAAHADPGIPRLLHQRGLRERSWWGARGCGREEGREEGRKKGGRERQRESARAEERERERARVESGQKFSTVSVPQRFYVFSIFV